ncbi:hypothetical protein C2E21_5030 [Chlorella sorokiniana]|uniref:Uncharacterized protein n=1 Tax=Chlorella sorokiniana TaxID=3076 RepID=A0A2P6TPC5_CHLSO|nr:hypothetical protein C2E21_5030 [Chlorella sorokiniana]|eukprot:PRW55888.1 hypothetical protein C2E21_5030 [Chlorella sorokiniana]
MSHPKATLALFLALIAASQAAAAADGEGAAAVRRSLLSTSPSVGPIYSNGNLEWRSWSWGLSSLNVRDAGKPMPGARAALCLAIQPFGALSLRSSVPFSLEGALGFYIRGNGNSSAAQLGSLEMQFESSSPSRYAITRSSTLAEALAAQAVAEGAPASTADALLAGIAAGQWTPVKVPLAAFEAQAGFKADRWTLGSCLQRLDGCSSAAPAAEVCLDQIVTVS